MREHSTAGRDGTVQPSRRRSRSRAWQWPIGEVASIPTRWQAQGLGWTPCLLAPALPAGEHKTSTRAAIACAAPQQCLRRLIGCTAAGSGSGTEPLCVWLCGDRRSSYLLGQRTCSDVRPGAGSCHGLTASARHVLIVQQRTISFIQDAFGSKDNEGWDRSVNVWFRDKNGTVLNGNISLMPKNKNLKLAHRRAGIERTDSVALRLACKTTQHAGVGAGAEVVSSAGASSGWERIGAMSSGRRAEVHGGEL